MVDMPIAHLTRRNEEATDILWMHKIPRHHLWFLMVDSLVNAKKPWFKPWFQSGA